MNLSRYNKPRQGLKTTLPFSNSGPIAIANTGCKNSSINERASDPDGGGLNTWLMLEMLGETSSLASSIATYI